LENQESGMRGAYLAIGTLVSTGMDSVSTFVLSQIMTLIIAAIYVFSWHQMIGVDRLMLAIFKEPSVAGAIKDTLSVVIFISHICQSIACHFLTLTLIFAKFVFRLGSLRYF
jgi:hypothetical protein